MGSIYESLYELMEKGAIEKFSYLHGTWTVSGSGWKTEMSDEDVVVFVKTLQKEG